MGAPGPGEFRLAIGLGMLSLVVLVALAPFAARPLPHFTAFAPADNAYAFLCALITALLLLGEVGVARSNAVLALAVGYMCIALTAMLQFLSHSGNVLAFGGLQAEAGPTLWLILIRGALLPVSIIIYARVQSAPTQTPESSTRTQSWRSVILGVAPAMILLWGALPFIVMGGGSILNLVVTAPENSIVFKAANQITVIIALAAMVVLASRRFKTRFDLWLFMTLLASLCQVVISGLLGGAPYDLGWYGGLAFGAAGSAALMVALLYESANHFEQLAHMHEALLASNRSLEHLSLHDSLTGLANRRHFDNYVAQQVELMRRHRRPLALVLCDIDDFKAFNDVHGHLAGDDCLSRIAVALQACCRRPADMAARYGGEEFALVLPETDLAGAIRIAEAAREAVNRLSIAKGSAGIGSVMTISGGVAILDGNGDGSVNSLVGAADAALFEAKRQGRDRVVSSKREFAGV